MPDICEYSTFIPFQCYLLANITEGFGDDNAANSSRLLQPIWSVALSYSHYTSSAVFPNAVFGAVFMLCTALFMVLELCTVYWPELNKYRSRRSSEFSWSRLKPVIIGVFWGQLLYAVPLSLLQWAILPDTIMPPVAPSLWEFIWQLCVAVFLCDAVVYIKHRIEHKNRFIYRNVHSVHHRSKNPSSWETLYIHPAEMYFFAGLIRTPPMLLGAHPLTTWCILAVVMMLSVETHCGFDFPFMLHHWIPFWGGPTKHDLHHERPDTNFQSFFNHFDKLFGDHVVS